MFGLCIVSLFVIFCEHEIEMRTNVKQNDGFRQADL